MIDWKLTKLKTGYDKSYFDKYSKSARLVYRICNKCKQGKWIHYYNYFDLCQNCGRSKKASEKTKQKMRISRMGYITPKETKEKISKSLMGHSVSDESKEKNRLAHLGKKHKLPIPKFIKEEDRFIKETQIDRIETIKQFGYDPIDLKEKSGKKVWIICKNCNKGREAIRQKSPDLCRSCVVKYRHQLPNPKFIKEENRFIFETGIDRILTIEKFGYDPIDLTEKSNRKIITICQQCGKSRIIIKAGYSDLCNSCWSDKSRIKASCTRQNINKENFSGFIGKYPERDYILSKELCIKLNTYFKGSEFHHIISGVGIYIPKDLHQSIRHNMKNGNNINEINKLAFNYLMGDI